MAMGGLLATGDGSVAGLIKGACRIKDRERRRPSKIGISYRSPDLNEPLGGPYRNGLRARVIERTTPRLKMSRTSTTREGGSPSTSYRRSNAASKSSDSKATPWSSCSPASSRIGQRTGSPPYQKVRPNEPQARQRFAHDRAGRLGRLAERQPHLGAHMPHLMQGPFERNRIAFGKKRGGERPHALFDRARLVLLASRTAEIDAAALLRHDIR